MIKTITKQTIIFVWSVYTLITNSLSAGNWISFALNVVSIVKFRVTWNESRKQSKSLVTESKDMKHGDSHESIAD